MPITAPAYLCSPLTDNCGTVARSAHHACFGISPFNSYFSTERITSLAAWGLARFTSMHFFVPDVPAAYTLEALGYPPKRAAWKARRQGQYLLNKIHTALTSIGVDDPERHILDWSTLTTNTVYRRLRDQAQHLFDTEPEFRAQCLDASGWVLDKRLPASTQPSAAQLHSAVRYLLAELSLFINTPAIVGHRASVFCYHQTVAFLNRLYRRELSWHPVPHQGFTVITPPAPTPTDTKPTGKQRP